MMLWNYHCGMVVTYSDVVGAYHYGVVGGFL